MLELRPPTPVVCWTSDDCPRPVYTIMLTGYIYILFTGLYCMIQDLLHIFADQTKR
jgi:hypothetical protein